MRPQMFNEVRRNEAIVQCENCQRILYYVPAPASQAS
jgi:predicted  nucleic acid-binding Zn-ribbon protein